MDVRKKYAYIYIYVHHIQAAQEKIIGRNDRLSVRFTNLCLLAQRFQDQGEVPHDILNQPRL
jgi:hypothetical protein